MADHVLAIERVSGGKRIPVPDGSSVRPGEGIYLTVTHIGSLIDPTVQFSVREEGGGVVFEASKAPGLGSSQVNLFWVAPVKEAQYVVEAKLHSFPFLPQTHSELATFFVSSEAPAPPEPPGGGLDLGDVKTIAFIVLGIIAVGVAGNVARSRR